MVAILVCQDRKCRATFEAEGSRDSIEHLHCQDCGRLHGILGEVIAHHARRVAAEGAT